MSGQVGLGQLSSVDPDTGHGRVVPVSIPDTDRSFTHREEFVYLPPAWFRSARKEQFPVIEMIGAEFSTPENWIRAGDAEDHLAQDVPAYVAAHFGVAKTGWTVAGWSMGGTCAVDLAVEHPGVFTRFLDGSGDLSPNVGDQAIPVTGRRA